MYYIYSINMKNTIMNTEIINRLREIKQKDCSNGPLANAPLFSPYGDLNDLQISKTDAYLELLAKVNKGWSLDQVWSNTRLTPVSFSKTVSKFI